MTRPSDITRERILKAAERLFADRGYEETSIRAIVVKARVNQAAIMLGFEPIAPLTSKRLKGPTFDHDFAPECLRVSWPQYFN